MMHDMKRTNIYIQAAEQTSIQQPLSEEWMETPVMSFDTPLVKAVNPVFRDFLAPNDARRMGNLMKRALVTALKVLKDTGIAHPDAIITGTSIGSLDYTEKFLDAMVENGEETLSPTYFMQSTHNTVSSTLSIHTKTNGYNSTYSHGAISFDLAVLDAWMQMQLGKISTALVGGHDEMVESYYELLKKTGYVGQEGMVPCGEVSMSMMLNTDSSQDCLCELAGIRISHRPSMEQLKLQTAQLLQEAGLTLGDVSAVMTGVNGNVRNDACYHALTDILFAGMPMLRYKHLFGENYTVSALGLYAAAHCLKRGAVPVSLYDSRRTVLCNDPRAIMVVNVTESSDYSLILLKKK